MLTSRVAVTIHVLDVNEFAPELAIPYESFVCENAKVGQVSECVYMSPKGYVPNVTIFPMYCTTFDQGPLWYKEPLNMNIQLCTICFRCLFKTK